jgi:hypothetical protein
LSEPEPYYLHWVEEGDAIRTQLLDVENGALALNAAKAKSFADGVLRARVGSLDPEVDQRWYAAGKPMGDPIPANRPVTHIIPADE